MIDSKSIYERLKTKNPSAQTYEVFPADEACYFGKDRDNNVVFMIPSLMVRIAPVYQETRSLRFAFNKKCTFRNGDIIETRTVHLLTCKEKDEDKIISWESTYNGAK